MTSGNIFVITPVPRVNLPSLSVNRWPFSQTIGFSNWRFRVASSPGDEVESEHIEDLSENKARFVPMQMLFPDEIWTQSIETVFIVVSVQ